MGINLKSLLAGGASALIESAGKAVDSLITSKEEAEALKIELQKSVNNHIEVMALRANESEAAYLKDVDSARQMQIEALKQSDLFSKRFIYYLAAGVIILVFAFDIQLFYVDYPEKNRDIINMVAGVLNATALVMILSFFFGSSKGSKDAGDRMDKMVEKVIESK